MNKNIFKYIVLILFSISFVIGCDQEPDRSNKQSNHNYKITLHRGDCIVGQWYSVDRPYMSNSGILHFDNADTNKEVMVSGIIVVEQQ
jgi:hypothetical protein